MPHARHNPVMAEIINLKRVRKQRARADKEKTAEANRLLHGTPAHLRKTEQARKDQAAERHAGHKLEDGDK